MQKMRAVGCPCAHRRRPRHLFAPSSPRKRSLAAAAALLLPLQRCLHLWPACLPPQPPLLPACAAATARAPGKRFRAQSAAVRSPSRPAPFPSPPSHPTRATPLAMHALLRACDRHHRRSAPPPLAARRAAAAPSRHRAERLRWCSLADCHPHGSSRPSWRCAEGAATSRFTG